MTDKLSFPRFVDQLPELAVFLPELVQSFYAGEFPSWERMAERVHDFFTPARSAEMEAVAPGWGEMASYAEGVTLAHVMCVFTGLLSSPEYQSASMAQQALMQWIVLFHDIAKVVEEGRRDYTHSFRSAARAAAALPRLGFPTSPEFGREFDKWFALTHAAQTTQAASGEIIQDNRQLPAILTGIERLFGELFDPDIPFV